MSTYLHRRAGWIHLYPFLFPLCLLIAGIVLQQALPDVPGLFWLLSLSGLLCASILLHIPHNVSQRITLLRWFSIALTVAATGATLCYYRDIRHTPDWYGHHLEQTEALAVKIIRPPHDKQRSRLLPVQVIRILKQEQWQPASGSLNLYVYLSDSLPVYRTGDILLLPNTLIPVKNSGNPFSFDYKSYAARNGIFHQAFLAAGEIEIIQRQQQPPSPLERSRAGLMLCIKDNVKDSTTRSLVEATLLNERSLLDDELWQAYSITGIVHIIAISGMHVAILFSIILFLLSWFRYKRLNWIKYLIALPLVWGYIALTGFPPSAVRAAVTFTLLAIGICISKEGNAINTWAATAFLLLCYNPYWLWDVGVQLSFLAVLSILLFYKPIRNWVTPSNKALQITWDTFAVSIAAQLLVFPLVMYYFHQFPLLGLVASIPAALYSTLLMVGALILFVWGLCFGSCIWLGNLLAWLTGLFHTIIIGLARLTPEWIRHLSLSITDYWLMMAAVVCFCIYGSRYNTRYLVSGLSFCCLLVLSLLYQDLSALQEKRLVVYNVARQGLADYFERKKVCYSGIPAADSLDAKTHSYTLFPSRLGYHALNPDGHSSSSCAWKIGTAALLYLKEEVTISEGATFPVDYLIVSNNCRYKGAAWQKVFHPKMIVIDGSVSRKKAMRWKAGLQQLGIPVHWVQEDGAWIFARSEKK